MIDSEKNFEWCLQHITNGQLRILESVRILVYKESPSLFELLDYESDKIFNEPFLFAFFHSNKKGATLEQILWGHIEDLKRPKSITALTDHEGILYLPKLAG